MVDSNIIIYAYDPTDPAKQATAIKLIEEQIAKRTLVVSAQVLNEFYHRATRSNRPPSLSHEAAAAVVQKIVDAAVVLPITAAVTLRALGGVASYGMSFWDALIWAAASENAETVIYTEDLPGLADVEGVRYVNPFDAESAP